MIASYIRFIMTQILSIRHLISQLFAPFGKVIVDIGCGTGELVKYLLQQGADAYGIDQEEIIAGIPHNNPDIKNRFKQGCGEKLPFPDNFADILLYIDSFHHISPGKMNHALQECRRVLKDKGQLVILEPVASEQSYYELVRLILDEKEMQKEALNVIQTAQNHGFLSEKEDFFFLERTCEDFHALVLSTIKTPEQRATIRKKAVPVFWKLTRNNNSNGHSLKSYSRLSVLRKSPVIN